MKDQELQEKIKKVLSIHAEFLSAWLTTGTKGEWDAPVTLEDYEANEYGPRSVLRTHDEGADFDILTLWVNPFQDEGGPMILVALFGEREVYGDEPRWIVQHFDTEGSMIWPRDRGAWP